MSRKSFELWRPFQGKGAAFIFNTSYDKAGKLNIFLKSMPEKEGGGFDSAASINFKFGIADIGEILALADGKKSGLGTFKAETKKWGGLFHKTPSSNSILSIDEAQTPGKYNMRLSKKSNGGDAVAHNVQISVADLNLLKYFFVSLLDEVFSSDMVKENSSPDSPSPAVSNKKNDSAPEDDDPFN